MAELKLRFETLTPRGREVMAFVASGRFEQNIDALDLVGYKVSLPNSSNSITALQPLGRGLESRIPVCGSPVHVAHHQPHRRGIREPDLHLFHSRSSWKSAVDGKDCYRIRCSRCGRVY